MIRLLYLMLAGFMLFMWSVIARELPSVPVLAQIGVHIAFGSMMAICLIQIIRGDD